MAQDRAFPWSDWLEKMNHKLQIPLNFMLVLVVVEAVLGVISLGSDLAFNAIVSGAGVSFTIGYTLPVIVVSNFHIQLSRLYPHGMGRLLFEAGRYCQIVPILISDVGDI